MRFIRQTFPRKYLSRGNNIFQYWRTREDTLPHGRSGQSFTKRNEVFPSRFHAGRNFMLSVLSHLRSTWPQTRVAFTPREFTFETAEIYTEWIRCASVVFPFPLCFISSTTRPDRRARWQMTNAHILSSNLAFLHRVRDLSKRCE